MCSEIRADKTLRASLLFDVAAREHAPRGTYGGGIYRDSGKMLGKSEIVGYEEYGSVIFRQVLREIKVMLEELNTSRYEV